MNQLKVFHVDSTGSFVEKAAYDPPLSLDNNRNFEGIAFFPDSVSNSTSGFKPFFWVDDGGRNGKTILQAEIQFPLP